MSEPDDPRGTANRGTSSRLAAPPPPPQDYPPFDVRLLGLFGQEAIPDALAYALKWQFELDQLQLGGAEPTEAQQELANQLLAVFDFLILQEQRVARDPRDGALLYEDALRQLAARAVVNPRLIETVDGTSIPVSDDVPDAPLPVWVPSLLPRGLDDAARSAQGQSASR